MLWRLHFLSGFLVAPIVVSLALTGILFAWHPQLEAVIYDDALSAVAAGPAQPLAEQVTSARTARPGWELQAVIPAAEGGQETTAVTLAPPEAGSAGFGPVEGAVIVFVDPASAQVTGQIAGTDRLDEWLRNLHSSWRLGPPAEPVTELAASWVLVSLLTGLYLWWPRSRGGWRRAFRLGRPGRPRWRSVHTWLGLGVLVALLLMVGTGLTWTRFAGTWIDLAKAQFSSQAPSASTELASSNAGVAPAPRPVASVDRIAAGARHAGLDGVVQISPPDRAGAAWTVARQDSRWPLEPTEIAVDPATGKVADRVEWPDYPLLAKATTMGIAFHQAQLFGLANQIFLTLLAVGLIVLIAAGYRMWWLRRPAGGVGAPPRAGPLLRSVPVPLLAGFGLLMVLLPMLGVSFLAYLAIERLARVWQGARA